MTVNRFTGEVDKNNPSSEWIEYLAARHEWCEPEIREVLNRKLRRRAGPGYKAHNLDELVARLEKLIAAELETPFEISRARWLTGGASKIQLAFDLSWTPAEQQTTTTAMVLRMQPPESIVETSRIREFELLKTVSERLPVPAVYWVDDDASYLPEPGLVYGFVEGVIKPSDSSNSVSGMGTRYPEGLRDRLAEQFVDHLAALHTFDWPDNSLNHFHLPVVPVQPVASEIAHWDRVWEEDSSEDLPLMRLASRWLWANMPEVDQLSVLHGDYRTGNFLFDEDSHEITAWLDWENGTLGDRHMDLAYTCCSVFGHVDPDSGEFMVGSLMRRGEFLEAYEKASGLSVDPQRMRYYNILNLYKLITMVIATAPRVMRGGKTHQDVTLSWPVAAGYIFLEDLRQAMSEVV